MLQSPAGGGRCGGKRLAWAVATTKYHTGAQMVKTSTFFLTLGPNDEGAELKKVERVPCGQS